MVSSIIDSLSGQRDNKSGYKKKGRETKQAQNARPTFYGEVISFSCRKENRATFEQSLLSVSSLSVGVTRIKLELVSQWSLFVVGQWQGSYV